MAPPTTSPSTEPATGSTTGPTARPTPGPAAGGDPARTPSPSAPPVLRALLEDGHRFDFFQAVWLLEQHLDRPGAPDLFRRSPRRRAAPRIRIRPASSSAFPAADVRRVDLQDVPGRGPTAEVEVTFMGLYGVNAPLPSYFVERIVRTPEEGAVLRDFLDLLNHRIYTLLYRGWKKFRPLRARAGRGAETDAVPGSSPSHRHRFDRLAGLPDGGPRPEPRTHRHSLAFAGRLAAHVRNREGLEGLLRAVLDVPVRICENVGRWVPLPSRPTLGRSTRRPVQVGRHGVVGERLFDVAGKFRIVLGPLDLATYRSLRPGGTGARTLQSVVTLYLLDALDYDVDLRLDPSDLAPAALGDDRSRVGSTARLGRPPDRVASEIVAY
jgi:type VI secretion system protein ImpH